MPKIRRPKSSGVTVAHLERLEGTLREQHRDLLRYMESRFDRQDRRIENLEHQFVIVNTKLDAIMSGEILVTRKQLRRLLSALKSKGVVIDESEILAA